MRRGRIDIESSLLHIAIIVSVFSQMDPLAKITRPAMYAMWVLLIGFAIVRSGNAFYISKFTKVFLVCYAVFATVCVVASVFDPVYLTANYLGMLRVPLLVTIIGDYYSTFLDKEKVQPFLRTYIGCAVVYAIWVQITYFPSYSAWLRANQYAFTLKNSAAQIWCSAILLLLCLVQYKTKRAKIVGLTCAAYLFVLTGISQCRTALLALFVVACAYAFVRTKKKYLVVIAIGVIAFAAWNIPFTRQFIDQALFLNKYAGADLNTFSSGRLDRFAVALRAFVDSPFIGTGYSTVDCSYICILAESGLVGFFLIETIWLFKMSQNLTYKSDRQEEVILFCLTIFYLVESLLERYPPFGPGVSSFMFWFLSAVFIGQKRKQRGNIVE